MRILAATAVLLAMLTGLAGAATVKFNLLSIEGLVIGTTLIIDDRFGKKYGVEIKSPFEILVPTAPEVLELMDPAPKPGEAYLKINFATEDKQLIENIQFVPMTIPMGPEDQRLQVAGKLLANNVFTRAVANAKSSKRINVRKVDINGYAAVEVVGMWESDDSGTMYIRIVGIPNPNGPESVFTVANIVAARQEVPTPDDLPRTRSGTTLRNFKYIR